MATANDVILGALRLLGVKEAGEPLKNNEDTDGLVALNDLLDSWSNERWMLTHITGITKTLTAGVRTYTIGSGGDIDEVWPVKIQSAFVRDANNYDSPLNPLTDEQYSRISLKETQSTYPRYYYYKRDYPLGSICLSDTPSSGLELHLRVFPQWAAFASGVTTVSFPPGYKRCLIYNLAPEIAPEYIDNINPLIMSQAIKSKAKIKAMNSVPPVMRSSVPLRGYYNRNAGDWF